MPWQAGGRDSERDPPASIHINKNRLDGLQIRKFAAIVSAHKIERTTA
jgi:hypothetical protein